MGVDTSDAGRAGTAANPGGARSDGIGRIVRRLAGDPPAIGPGPLADIGRVRQVLLDHAAAGTALAPEAAATLAGVLLGALDAIGPQLRAWEEVHDEALEQMALMDARVPPVPGTAMPPRGRPRPNGKT
jgi:hypothetical protein